MRTLARIFFFIFCFAVIPAEAQSVGGTTSGGASYCSSTNSGFISVTGSSGTILNWESTTDAGLSWTSIPNTTLSQSYFGLTQSTCYRVIVQSGAFPPDTSTTACITIYTPSLGGTISGGGNYCMASGNGTLTLSGNNGNPLFWEFSTDNGLSWTSVADTTTTLNYTSITQNTIYEAVVQNGATCPSDTSSQVGFIIDSLSNAGFITSGDTVCYGNNSGTLNATGITGNISSWLVSNDNGISWNPIANTTAAQSYSNLTQNSLYEIIAQNGSCPADTSLPVSILLFPQVIASAGNDTSILQGQTVVLQGSGNGNILWSPSSTLSNTLILNPSATPALTETYTLTISDTNGCSSSDKVTVNVIIPQFSGMVSNLFTPNGDGINDSWFIENIQNFPGNEVSVFNIYGNKVYEKKEYMNDWQGTYNGADLPDGTYYYILKFDAPQKTLKGSIDILRKN